MNSTMSDDERSRLRHANAMAKIGARIDALVASIRHEANSVPCRCGVRVGFHHVGCPRRPVQP